MNIAKKKISTSLGFMLTCIVLLGLANSNLVMARTSTMIFSIQLSQATRTNEFLFISNNMAYTPNGSGFAIYNVTTRTTPKVVAQFDFDNRTSGVTNFFVDNNNVYISDFDNKLFFADCSDSSNILQKNMLFDDVINHFFVKDSILYVLHSTNLTIYNIAGDTPTVIGNLKLNVTGLFHLAVHNDFAFCFEEGTSISIVNVTSTSNPTFQTSWVNDFATRQISHFDDYLFLIDSVDNIRVFDIINPINPLDVTNFKNTKATTLPIDISYSDNRVVVLYSNGFDVFDAENLSKVSMIQQYRLKGNLDVNFTSLQVIADFVFIRNMADYDLLYIFSISDPIRPEQVWPRTSNINPVAAGIVYAFSALVIIFSIAVIVLLIIKKKPDKQ